jgi:hypothetical protein
MAYRGFEPNPLRALEAAEANHQLRPSMFKPIALADE